MSDPSATPIPDFVQNLPRNDHGALFDAMMQQAARNPSSVAAMTKGFDPTQGMSPYDLLAAGAGQGMTQASLAGQQALANGNPLGLPPAIMDKVRADYIARAEAKEAMDSPLLATKAGKVGSIVGQTAAVAPFGPFLP